MGLRAKHALMRLHFQHIFKSRVYLLRDAGTREAETGGAAAPPPPCPLAGGARGAKVPFRFEFK